MAIENLPESIPHPSRNLPTVVGGPHVVVAPPLGHSLYNACRLVGEITNEMSALISGRPQYGRDRRRRLAHVRQIAMYVCHVCLRMQPIDIGRAFGRDPATVRYACHMVEDRRDDGAYDDFVSSIERMVASVFSAWGDEANA